VHRLLRKFKVSRDRRETYNDPHCLMPRPCRACSNRRRAEIDQALAAGESFRNAARRFGISATALFRHKSHAHDRPPSEYQLRWEKYRKAKQEGDDAGAVLALMEVRAFLEACSQKGTGSDNGTVWGLSLNASPKS
jgi:hypothetical protein